MAKDSEGFKGRWLPRLREWVDERANQLTAKPVANRYKDDHDFILKELNTAVLQSYKDCGLPQDSYEKFRERLFNHGNLSSVTQASRWFRDRYISLSDLRKQESRADWETNLRYLLFRALTAVSIAATVLATGWLAHIWGIPLPLLRLIP